MSSANFDSRQQIRHDPIAGHAVIIAPARALRPHDFSPPGNSSDPAAAPRRDCPFCEGHEYDTPGEVLARRAADSARDAPGWRVRVVPNKFPALGGIDAGDLAGSHEVIIETPRHVPRFSDLSDAELAVVFEVYAERMQGLAQDPRLAYGLIFKNVGAGAGASLEHPHSQLLALPFVPPLAQAEWDAACGWLAEHQECYWCQQIAAEQAAGIRLVDESPQFVAFAPFASRFAFEVCIVPRRHRGHFHAANPEELGELASIAKRVIARLERVLEPLAFNYFIHTSPFRAPDSTPAYHWHLEIVPRIANVAGFEWGSGCYINAVGPEVSARILRGET